MIALAAAAALVSVEPVSGTPQNQHAYVAPHDKAYLTTFPRPLVARVVGTRRAVKVRFTCERCVFAPAENGNDVTRVDESSYDVETKDGKATLNVVLSTGSPGGTYAVVASPAAEQGERSGRSARFLLTAR